MINVLSADAAKKISIIGIVLVIFLGLITGLFLLRFPLTIGSDSCKYLSGAKFLQTKGIYATYGPTKTKTRAIIEWPPFYSFLLSKSDLGSAGGEKKVHAFLWFLFWGNWGVLFIKWLHKPALIFMAVIGLFASSEAWYGLTQVASELPFLVVLPIPILFFASYDFSSQSPWRDIVKTIAGSFFLTLLCLTRYAGFAFILSTVFHLFLLRKRWAIKKYLIHASLNVGMCFGGIGLWMVRNKIMSGGLNAQINAPLMWNFKILGKAIDRLINGAFQIPSSWVYLKVFLIVAIFLLIASELKNRKYEKRCENTDLYELWIFFGALIYFTMLGVLAVTSKQNPEMRYFSILYPLIMGLLVKRGSCFFDARNNRLKKIASLSLLFVLCATWVNGTLRVKDVVENTKHLKKWNKTNFYFTPFISSPWLFDWLETHLQSSDVISSNFYDFLYVTLNRPVFALPLGEKDIKKYFLTNLPDGSNAVYLVLQKDNLWREYLPSADVVKSKWPQEIVYEDRFVLISKLK